MEGLFEYARVALGWSNRLERTMSRLVSLGLLWTSGVLRRSEGRYHHHHQRHETRRWVLAVDDIHIVYTVVIITSYSFLPRLIDSDDLS